VMWQDERHGRLRRTTTDASWRYHRDRRRDGVTRPSTTREPSCRMATSVAFDPGCLTRRSKRGRARLHGGV